MPIEGRVFSSIGCALGVIGSGAAFQFGLNILGAFALAVGLGLGAAALLIPE